MICICMKIPKYGKDFSLSKSISKTFTELNLYETWNMYDHKLRNQTHCFVSRVSMQANVDHIQYKALKS